MLVTRCAILGSWSAGGATGLTVRTDTPVICFRRSIRNGLPCLRFGASGNQPPGIRRRTTTSARPSSLHPAYGLCRSFREDPHLARRVKFLTLYQSLGAGTPLFGATA